MFRRRLASTVTHLRNHAASWLALIGQICALVGLPMPAVSAKDLSQPFPCQHRVCGCLNAADCWKNCCCFSARARVAWAEENGVVPPESLVEEAQHEDAVPTQCKTCCAAKKSNIVKKLLPAAASPPVRWQLAIQAMRCQGGFGDEGRPMPSYPPSRPVLWCFAWIADSEIPISTETPFMLTSLPLLPPPRG